MQYSKKLASLKINNPEDANRNVSLAFADGDEQTFDIVVGADGIRSVVKEHITQTRDNPVFSGSAIWYGAAKLPLRSSLLPHENNFNNDRTSPLLHEGMMVSWRYF